MRKLLNLVGPFAAVLAVSAVAVPAAHADMVFRNATGRTLHFEITCNGNVMDGWSLAPYGWRSIYCKNGSQVAAVRIRTDRNDGNEMVVRTTVYDGQAYVLGYDRDGDVNIWRG